MPFSVRAILLLLLVSAAHAQTDIRLGVLGLFHPSELMIEPAGVQILHIHADYSDILLNGEPNHRRLFIRASENQVVIQGVPASSCTVDARDASSSVRFRLSIPGKINRVYEGKLSITAHRGVLTAIVSMNRERAVASIVASEMPIDAPLEALRAQAVVTRSFLAAGPRHRDFDFCDTTHCQFLRSPDDVNARVAQAVASTHLLVLSWHNQTLPALYSSRCGGQTRSLAAVGMNAHDAYPYYSVQCKWCRDHPVRWQSRLDPAARAPQSSNESARIAYVRQSGWSALPGSNFIVTHEAGGIFLDGKSIGHSLGLCQFGAIGLAASGADFRSILAHYYPNTDVTQLTE